LINKKEYITLLGSCSVLNLFNYDDELLDIFDDVRKMYLGYCKEAAYHYVYPKIDINTVCAPILIELIRFCKQVDIKVEYEKLNKHTHEHGDYCIFFYKGVDITGIIDLKPGMKEFKYN
jgi:hypothetical protein